jgi:adenylate cyclase
LLIPATDDPPIIRNAKGVTEDVTTDLANVPSMYVVSRQTASAYKDKALDVRRVGEELGVRYALEGSVRKLGGELRVNAQLISTKPARIFGRNA